MTRRRRRARNARTAGVVMGVVMAASAVGVAAVDRDRFDPGTGVAIVQDPVLHPGATHPDLTKAQLCGDEFRTSQVRPPTSYTNKVKKLMLGDGGDIKAPNGRTYTVVGEHLPGSIGDYELDHLISLQIGGHPVDPRNLWMQPWTKTGSLKVERGAEEKDKIENALRRQVCKRGMPLAEAQRRIADDWRTALPEDE